MPDLPDIDSLWNYPDPRGSEATFRQLLDRVGSTAPADYVGQVLSQIARAQTLQKEYARALATLNEAAAGGADMPVAKIRIPLERGRIWNDTEEFGKARECFSEAVRLALEVGHAPLAADAFHMLGVLPPADEAVEWNRRGIEFARSSDNPKVRRWLGTFGLNMGLKHQDLRQFAEAERAFSEAIVEYERIGNVARVRLCRLCLGKNLRLQERYEAALVIDRELLAEIDGSDGPLGYTCEEIAECLVALGRGEEARPFFERAYKILSVDPWFPPPQRGRLVRIRQLAVGASKED